MKARVTIEWLEPTDEGILFPPNVLEFDQLVMSQSRPIQVEHNPDGTIARLIPDQITTTVLTGTKVTDVAAPDVLAKVSLLCGIAGTNRAGRQH